MRKLHLLVGALGGTLAGYLLSNKTLRKKLSIAKDPQAAAKILGAEISRSGKEVAHEIRQWVESDDVRHHLAKGKTALLEALDEARDLATKQTSSWISEAKSQGKKLLRSARKRMPSRR